MGRGLHQQLPCSSMRIPRIIIPLLWTGHQEFRACGKVSHGAWSRSFALAASLCTAPPDARLMLRAAAAGSWVRGAVIVSSSLVILATVALAAVAATSPGAGEAASEVTFFVVRAAACSTGPA